MADQENGPTASLSNIYYDCLERIFDFLDLKSLLNVAKTCKRLEMAAATKFGDDHGQKSINLTFPASSFTDMFGILVNRPGVVLMNNGEIVENNREFLRQQHELVRSRFEMRVLHDEIIIKSLPISLTFLRCFGGKILQLNCDGKWPLDYKTILDQYINQYCAETLISLVLGGRPSSFSFEKPFKNLEKLVIKDGFFADLFQNGVIWLPNLRHLEMNDVRVFADQRIRPLETLERLVINDGDLAHYLPNFVSWYPGLRHLELHSVYIHADHIAVSLPHLEHLGISMCQSTIEHITKLLNVNLQLQSLDISMIDEDETTNLAIILDMIRAHKSISKIGINLEDKTRVNATELSQLVKEHPSMTELNLKQYQFTADAAVDFIRQLKSLKKFTFCVQHDDEYKRILNELDGECHVERERDLIPEYDDDPTDAIVLICSH